MGLALGWDEDRRLAAATELAAKPLPDGVSASLRHQDQAALADLALRSPDPDVRVVIEPLVVEPAEVVRLALTSRYADTAVAAVGRITTREALERVLTTAEQPEARAAVIAKVDDPALRRHMAESADHWLVRRAAVLRLDDQNLLARIARADASGEVREAACARVQEAGLLATLAREAGDGRVRALAAERTDDLEALAYVIRHDGDAAVRLTGVNRLTSLVLRQGSLDWHSDLRLARAEELALLKQVARKERDLAIRQAARQGAERIEWFVESVLREARVAEKVRTATSVDEALETLKLVSGLNTLEEIAAGDSREPVRRAAQTRVDALRAAAAKSERARAEAEPGKAPSPGLLAPSGGEVQSAPATQAPVVAAGAGRSDGRALLRGRYPRFALGGAVLWGLPGLRFRDSLSTKGTSTWGDFWDTYTQSWQGALNVAYVERHALKPKGVELAGEVWLSSHYGIALVYQYRVAQVDADASLTLASDYTHTERDYPRDNVIHRAEHVSDSGSLHDLHRREKRLHVVLTRRIALARRLDVEVFLGPSLVRLSEEFVSWWDDEALDGMARNPWALWRTRLVGPMSGGTVLGVNVGAGASLGVGRSVAVVARLRYTHSPRVEVGGLDRKAFGALVGDVLWDTGTVPVEPSTSRVPSSGLTLTVGLRASFK